MDNENVPTNTISPEAEETQVEQPVPNTNKSGDAILSNLLKNKRLVLFSLVGLVLLLIILAVANPLMSGNPNTNQIPAQPKTTPTNDQASPTLSPTDVQSTTEAEKVTIETQAKPQIDKLVDGASYTISQIKTYTTDWAMIEITNPTAGPANIVLKKESDTWKIVMGPGTHFDQDALLQIGAPQSLINEANFRLHP